MHRELREQIKRATERSGINKLDFVALLKLIDAYYDKMEATVTQSSTIATPIEIIFDSVTDALMSVSDKGTIRNCNRVCSRYFGVSQDKLIGSDIAAILPLAKSMPLEEFLAPFMSDLDDTPRHLSPNN